MNDIKRNKDAGIPGNGGKFAPDTRIEASNTLISPEDGEVGVSEIRRGSIVNIDGEACMVVSTDSDHKSTSIEFSNGIIESFDNDEKLELSDPALAGKEQIVSELFDDLQIWGNGLTGEELLTFPDYYDDNFEEYAQKVARRAIENHGNDIYFSVERGPDGITGYTLGKGLPGGMNISERHSLLNLTNDHEASGVAGAVAVAEVIEIQRTDFLKRSETATRTKPAAKRVDVKKQAADLDALSVAWQKARAGDSDDSEFEAAQDYIEALEASVADAGVPITKPVWDEFDEDD